MVLHAGRTLINLKAPESQATTWASSFASSDIYHICIIMLLIYIYSDTEALLV